MSQEKTHRKQLCEHLSKNTGTCTCLLAPQRFAFCFANVRRLASHMERLPSTSSSWSQKAAPLDYLEIILSLTWEVLGPLYFLGNEAQPNDFESTWQHSLNRQTSYGRWKSGGPFLPPLTTARSVPNHIGLQPPKSFLRKSNGSQCQVQLR